MSAAEHFIMNMFKACKKNPSPYFSFKLKDDNIFEWRLTIIGPTGTLYEGGLFPCDLIFPVNFPRSPPKMRFVCPMFHPNIDKDGNVCISILHEAEFDEFNEKEELGEKWSPAQNVETIVLSVILLLQEPNPESTYNVEVNKVFLNDKKAYNRQVRKCTRESVNYCT